MVRKVGDVSNHPVRTSLLRIYVPVLDIVSLTWDDTSKLYAQSRSRRRALSYGA